MTLDEAVALLREAQNYVGFLPTRPDAIEKALSIQRRIDRALAAHDAEPEAVEWTNKSSTLVVASCGDGIEMWLSRWGDGVWHWWVEREFARTGSAATEDEAKAAALKAARSAR